MNPEVNAVIVELKTKINTLVERYTDIKTERDVLLQEKLDLLERVEIITKEKHDLEHRYNSLKISKMLTATGEEARETKRRIDKIVREIDDCIALLNK